jgi:hypothetical protein
MFKVFTGRWILFVRSSRCVPQNLASLLSGDHLQRKSMLYLLSLDAVDRYFCLWYLRIEVSHIYACFIVIWIEMNINNGWRVWQLICHHLLLSVLLLLEPLHQECEERERLIFCKIRLLLFIIILLPCFTQVALKCGPLPWLPI